MLLKVKTVHKLKKQTIYNLVQFATISFKFHKFK